MNESLRVKIQLINCAQKYSSGFFIAAFEQILLIDLKFSLLTTNKIAC